MNKIIIICFLYFSTTLTQAQVGIFTQNPKGVLHIDALANNPPVGNPSDMQQKDDVVFSVDASGISKLTVGSLPQNNSAQLQLASTSKAFLPNKIALTSTIDVTTVPNPQNGMFIYNTSIAGLGENSVEEGLYVYYDNKWNLVFMDNSAGYKRNSLKSTITLGVGNSSTPSAAVNADYGGITIDKDGAYAFMFRLYFVNNDYNKLTSPKRAVIYIWLYRNNVLVDVAELNPTYFNPPQGDAVTYSVALSADFKKGDLVQVRFSRNGSYPSTNMVAGTNNTMVYWRLEQYIK